MAGDGVSIERKPSDSALPSAEALDALGWVKKSRRDRRLQSRPRVGQYYWVDFPHDAYAPEFEGEHPGVVIRAASSLFDTCVVVPVTSRPQPREAHVHVFSQNPNPAGHVQGKIAHAVCDHVYTVHVNRLRPVLTLRGQPIFSKIDPRDLMGILTKVYSALGLPPSTVEARRAPVRSHDRPFGPKTLSLKGSGSNGG